MYLTESMHLNLCQDLKINLPQPPVTILVLCWLMHCNFSVLFLCHVYSLLLAVQSTSTRVCPSQPHDSSNKITQGPSWCTCIISNNSYFPLFYQLPSVLKKKKPPKNLLSQQTFSTLCGNSPRVCSPPARQMGNSVTAPVKIKMEVSDEFNMKMKFWLK